MIRLTPTFNEDEYKRAQARFSHLINEMEQEAGEAIIKVVDEAIRERVIPKGDQGDWVAWYLESMKWVYDERKHEWDLQVEEEIELEDIPDGRALVWVQGSWAILNEMSPWPVASIPRLKGGVPGRGLVRPVSADEHQHHRDRVSKNRSKVTDWLRNQELEAGAPDLDLEHGFQVDVDFLVGRIEHGIGGFNRQPHFVFIRQMIEKRFGR